MARFYGTVQGGRGEATRLGNSKSGLTVTARTWGESFMVRLWANDSEGPEQKDYGSVHLGGYCLFHGDTNALKSREGRVQWIAGLVMDTSLRKEIVEELARRGLMEKFG